MRRRAAAALVAMCSVLIAPATAGALGTSQFTVTPGPGATREAGSERIIVEPKRGGTSHSSIRVANRLDRPLVLRIAVEPVTVGSDGGAALGGDDTAVGWVHVDRERVELDPHADAVLALTVHVPRSASSTARTVALVAEPVSDGVSAPSVVQRLALVVHVRPHGTAPRPMVLILIALAVAMLVLAAIVWRAPALRRAAAR